MTYKTCPDCGSRVYNLGCTWCNEEDYIAEQADFDRESICHGQQLSRKVTDEAERKADQRTT